MRFRSRLQAALLQRQRINPAYTLRSFARALKADHSTLSRTLRERRRITARTIRRWGPRLGLNPRELDELCYLEHEASILAAIERTCFRPDSRWLAMTLNIPLDEVNIALQRLLHKRLLRMRSHNNWQREESHG